MIREISDAIHIFTKPLKHCSYRVYEPTHSSFIRRVAVVEVSYLGENYICEVDDHYLGGIDILEWCYSFVTDIVIHRSISEENDL